MTKRELIEKLAEKERIDLKAAEAAVNVAFESMRIALSRGDRIEIRGLGSFEVKEYEGYSGRNPKTGLMIEVKGKRLPFFKMGKELKMRLKGKES